MFGQRFAVDLIVKDIDQVAQETLPENYQTLICRPATGDAYNWIVKAA